MVVVIYGCVCSAESVPLSALSLSFSGTVPWTKYVLQSLFS